MSLPRRCVLRSLTLETKPLRYRSDVATTSERRCRSSPTSPTPSWTGSSGCPSCPWTAARTSPMSALSRWLFFSGIQLALTALSSPRVQLGGTVGDIESMPFVEAMRQFQFKVKPENFCLVIIYLISRSLTFYFPKAHVSLIPVVSGGEQKSKPTQASVRDLRGLGLSPDFVCLSLSLCLFFILMSFVPRLCAAATPRLSRTFSKRLPCFATSIPRTSLACTTANLSIRCPCCSKSRVFCLFVCGLFFV